MNRIVVFLYLVFITQSVVFSALTEKQMNATKKLIRNTCLNKAKPSSDQVDGLQKGNFVDDKNLQCYTYCVLNTYKLIRKDNSFDWEGGVAALEANAPTNIAGPGAKTIVNCKDAVKTATDKCMAAYEIARCIYDDNPSNYFLP
uniref:Odorant binding protein 8 n=1 Tax=Xylotrechus quadripes TaxID=554073 RepID=A0A346HGN0_9CUCU|nr:odorant binding protein 8 [Xylotrechus quadripes]